MENSAGLLGDLILWRGGRKEEVKKENKKNFFYWCLVCFVFVTSPRPVPRTPLPPLPMALTHNTQDSTMRKKKLVR